MVSNFRSPILFSNLLRVEKERREDLGERQVITILLKESCLILIYFDKLRIKF